MVHIIISIVLLSLVVCGVGAYFLWLRPLMAKPLSATLDLEAVKPAEIPTLPSTGDQEEDPGDQAEQADEGDQQHGQDAPILDLNALQQEKEAAQLENTNPPICGDEKELLILAVGIDYRGEDYLYGLGDVIRVIHVDYTIPQVNVVALPRTLLISNLGERLDVEGPITIEGTTASFEEWRQGISLEDGDGTFNVHGVINHDSINLNFLLVR